MLGAHKKGHTIYYLSSEGMSLINGILHFHVTEVIPQSDNEIPFLKQKNLDLTEGDVDAVFIRSDPPFDYKYLLHTWILERLSYHIPVINDPVGIRNANEKIWATKFLSITPRTIISQYKEDLINFRKAFSEVFSRVQLICARFSSRF